MLLKNCYQNILETSTVTLATGAEDASYPLYRLYDRDIGRLFKTTAAVTTTVKVDQGASPAAIDRLLIPAGHNLSGMTLDIKWSTDDITYTAAVAQWVGAAGFINKEWASLTKRYWKFIITTPGSIPQIAELFLCPTYTWEKNPSRPNGASDPAFNIERLQSASGDIRYLKNGDPKQRRAYQMPRCREAQKDNIDALNDAWAGYKPFWLCDDAGIWIYGEITAPINLRQVAAGTYAFDFTFQEVLP